MSSNDKLKTEIRIDISIKLAHGTDNETAINAVMEQLAKHGMTALGENQSIPLETSRALLENAMAE